MSSSVTIDLRSDTVTRPTAAMREAMASAEVGDDVFGDDPTVNRLQAIAAELLGMEAALLLPSGTQSNLCALLGHCDRGDEYIVGQTAHTYMYEGGGAAVLGSIQPQPLDFRRDGTLDLEQVAACIKPDDPHFARSRLLSLENTQAGKVLPLDYLASAREFVDEHRLALHLDGARIFNASAKLDVPVTAITRHFDSVSVCLSKGLGAPAGSVLCGTAAFIDKARRWRKMLGGAMRQSGILAAAGIVALQEHVDRLPEDHANAAQFAATLALAPGIDIDPESVQTNIIFVPVAAGSLPAIIRHLAGEGILVSGSRDTMRLVTHYDFDAQNIETAAAAIVSAIARH